MRSPFGLGATKTSKSRYSTNEFAVNVNGTAVILGLLFGKEFKRIDRFVVDPYLEMDVIA